MSSDSVSGAPSELCSACRQGEGVARLLENMKTRQHWEQRLQLCREECMRCTGSMQLERECRNIYCDVYFRKAEADRYSDRRQKVGDKAFTAVVWCSIIIRISRCYRLTCLHVVLVHLICTEIYSSCILYKHCTGTTEVAGAC